MGFLARAMRVDNGFLARVLRGSSFERVFVCENHWRHLLNGPTPHTHNPLI